MANTVIMMRSAVSVLFMGILVLQQFMGVNSNFSALLAIGDSTIDSGNNNYIPTLAKANFYPYGRDFPGHHATGRFSNGKLVTDFLAQGLGLKETLPAYLDPSLSPQDLLTGVSFASASTGFDDVTASSYGVIPISRQLGYLREYKRKLAAAFGEYKMQSVIENALFMVSCGSNDFLVNYFVLPNRRQQYNIEQYQMFLVRAVHDLVQNLYKEGARHISVSGLPPLGSVPLSTLTDILALQTSAGANHIAQSYNSMLRSMLESQAKSLGFSVKLAYVDIYGPFFQIFNNHQSYGMDVVDRGCCGTGSIEVAIFCNALDGVCDDDSRYFFFDAVHPTQKVYQFIAQTMLQRDIPRLL